MSGLDVVPPTSPERENRPGFLGRLFGRKKEKLVDVSPDLGDMDLEAIKAKIGLDGDLDTLREPSVIAPTEQQPVEVDTPSEITGAEEPGFDPVPNVQSPPAASEEGSTFDTPPPMESGESPEWHDTPSVEEKPDSAWTTHPTEESVQEATHEKEVDKPQLPSEDKLTDTPSWTNNDNEGPQKGKPESTWTAQPELPSLDTDESLEPSLIEEDTNEPPIRQEPDFQDLPQHYQVIAKSHLKQIEKEHRKLDKAVSRVIETPTSEPPSLTQHPLEKGAPEGKEFTLPDGTRLRTLADLMVAVHGMDEETWNHHVSGEKNDFANWLQHVLNEEKLAEQARTVTAQQELHRILKAHERKIDRLLQEEERKLQEILGRKKKVREAEQLTEQLDNLKEELARKSAEVDGEKQALQGKTAQRIDEEVKQRLEAEHATLEQARRSAEEMRREYEIRLKELEEMHGEHQREHADRMESLEHHASTAISERESELMAREAKVKAKEESLLNLERTIQSERQQLDREKAEAQPMFEEAKHAEEMLASSEKARAATEEKNSQLSAREKNLKEREEELVHKEEEIQLDRAALNKREQQLTKLEVQQKRLQESLKKEKVEHERKSKAFHLEEEQTREKLAAEQHELEMRIKRAEEAEQRLEEKLKERRKISKYIAEAEKVLEQRDSAATNFSATSEGETDRIRNLEVYKLIDQAREALDGHDLVKSRELYNKVRDAFNKEALSPHEKSALYSSIRELYDDLHLASAKT